jgi:hypothetical protein
VARPPGFLKSAAMSTVCTLILFSCDPLAPRRVDPEFAEEARAASASG